MKGNIHILSLYDVILLIPNPPDCQDLRFIILNHQSCFIGTLQMRMVYAHCIM